MQLTESAFKCLLQCFSPSATEHTQHWRRRDWFRPDQHHLCLNAYVLNVSLHFASVTAEVSISAVKPPPGFFRQVLDYDFNCVLNGSWPAEGLKIDIILIRPDCHALPLCGLIQMSRPHCSCTFMFPGSRHVRRAVQTHYSHWEPRTDFLQTSRVILVCKLSELNYQPLAVL